MVSGNLFGAQKMQKSGFPFSWRVLAVSAALFAGIAVALIVFLRPASKEQAQLEGVLRDGDASFQWYRKYVRLKDPQIKMGQNFTGKRMVIFSAIIENQGEKMLDVVEVELKFFNYDKLVWSTRRTPIVPGPYTPAIQPLEERGFTLYMERIPEDWLANHAEMEVTGFRFASPS